MSKFAPHGYSTNRPRATPGTVCQKCLKTGHFTFECKSTRPYVSRPSRTQQLENPKLLLKARAEGKSSAEISEDFKDKSGTANKILELKEKQRMEIKNKEEGPSNKRARRDSSSSSSSDSDTPDPDSSSNSESESESSDSDSDSSSSHSRERNRKRPLPRGGRSRLRSLSHSTEHSQNSRHKRH